MKTTKPSHVAVFAFPFGSHPLPLLSLVRKLARAAPTVRFSFFSTAKSNDTLFLAKQSATFPDNVKAHAVPDGVPDGHVLSGHPFEPVGLYLNSAPNSLRKAAESAAEEAGASITCVISDAFLPFSAEIADQLNVPWVPVWLPLSISLPVHANTKTLRRIYGGGGDGSRRPVDDVIPGLSAVTVADFPDEILVDRDSAFSQTLSQFEDVMPRAKAVVVNFYQELNPPLLNSFVKSKLPHVLNVGFLTVQSPPPQPVSDATGCLAWLDGQRAGSVAYVSFGTVVTPPPEEVRAVAEALEASKVPFLWSMKDSMNNMLPEGFEERTEERGTGKIVTWAPQIHVLGHLSVGVFVTHCGCNSVFESVWCGVPLICRPFFGDHRLGGWMVQNYWKVGLRVEGGGITRSGLVEKLKVILGNEGKEIREKARELKKKVLEAAKGDGTAAQDFNTLVHIVSASS